MRDRAGCVGNDALLTPERAEAVRIVGAKHWSHRFRSRKKNGGKRQ
jgi:hypothetical protein